MKTSTSKYAAMNTELLLLAQAGCEEVIGNLRRAWEDLGRKLDADDILYAASAGCEVAKSLVANAKEMDAINAELFLRD